MKPDEQEDWNEHQEPEGFGRIEEAADLLAAVVIGFVVAGIIYTFGI